MFNEMQKSQNSLGNFHKWCLIFGVIFDPPRSLSPLMFDFYLLMSDFLFKTPNPPYPPLLKLDIIYARIFTITEKVISFIVMESVTYLFVQNWCKHENASQCSSANY